MRTRYWDNPERLSNTAVQFRDDADPMVWLHSNIGWVGIGNTPKDATGAEKFAEEIAASYSLTEASPAVAKYMVDG